MFRIQIVLSFENEKQIGYQQAYSEIEPYFEAFIRCQIFIRLFRREALISDYLILWMSAAAKILSGVNLLARYCGFDHLVQDSFVDKIDPCKIAPHATIKIQI